MKVKDLVRLGLEDYDIILSENVLLQRGDWPTNCQYSLGIEIVKATDKTIVLEKNRRIK